MSKSYLEAAVFFFPQVLSDEVHGRHELDGPHQDQARFDRECLWKSATSSEINLEMKHTFPFTHLCRQS